MYYLSKRIVLLIAAVIFLAAFGAVYFGRQASQKQAYLNELKALSFQ